MIWAFGSLFTLSVQWSFSTVIIQKKNIIKIEEEKEENVGGERKKNEDWQDVEEIKAKNIGRKNYKKLNNKKW